MHTSFLLVVIGIPALLTSCSDSDAREPDLTPVIAEIPVAPCAAIPGLDEVEAVAQGTVIDYVTGEPRAGVTVDIARAWEPGTRFPTDSCSLARLTTDADGRFGPVTVKVGPRPRMYEHKFVVLLAQGAGISPTASDTKAEFHSIAHVIEAPSLEQVDAWRAELDEGGMQMARTRGLVAYTYQEADGTPAAGVAAQQALSDRTLAPGEEVRYLSTDRQTLLPRAQTTTTASGIALIGSNWSFENRIEIGGERGTDHWGSIGALLGEGWLFIESSRRRTF